MTNFRPNPLIQDGPEALSSTLPTYVIFKALPYPSLMNSSGFHVDNMTRLVKIWNFFSEFTDQELNLFTAKANPDEILSNLRFTGGFKIGEYANKNIRFAILDNARTFICADTDNRLFTVNPTVENFIDFYELADCWNNSQKSEMAEPSKTEIAEETSLEEVIETLTDIYEEADHSRGYASNKSAQISSTAMHEFALLLANFSKSKNHNPFSSDTHQSNAAQGTVKELFIKYASASGDAEKMKITLAGIAAPNRVVDLGMVPVTLTFPEEKLPTAADFVDAAKGHMNAREVEYDTPGGERSMGKTVEMFNTLFDKDLTEEQGWQFMSLLKKVRTTTGKFKADNYEDDTAYAALSGEAAARDRGNFK